MSRGCRLMLVPGKSQEIDPITVILQEMPITRPLRSPIKGRGAHYKSNKDRDAKFWRIGLNVNKTQYIYGLVQYCSNSIALAMELSQSCTKLSICRHHISVLSLSFIFTKTTILNHTVQVTVLHRNNLLIHRPNPPPNAKFCLLKFVNTG